MLLRGDVKMQRRVDVISVSSRRIVPASDNNGCACLLLNIHQCSSAGELISYAVGVIVDEHIFRLSLHQLISMNECCLCANKSAAK